MMHIVFAAALALLPAKDVGAPGAQILIERHGKIREEDYGVRSLASGLPVDSHTRFEIGSITKQFTAAAILQLKEQGKLSLSDPLGKYIPQYAAGRDITIQQLLWMVSGIPDYVQTKAFNALIVQRNGAMVMDEPRTLQRVLSFIGAKPLDFTPGSRWEYSSTNYFFLGEIVEQVSGMPYESYIRTHIFAPAKMTDSAFMTDEPALSDMATGYALSDSTHKPIPTGAILGAGGDGAIVSTASDLGRWDDALFGGKIITKSDLALMTAPGPVPAGPGAHYGFGWLIHRFYDIERMDHNGETLGFTASNQMYPSLDARVIVLTNAAYAHTSALAGDALLQQFPQVKAAYLRPAPGENPSVTSTARELWNEVVTGSFKPSAFTPKFYAFLTAHRGDAKKWFGNLPPPSAFIYKGTVPVHTGIIGYKYRLIFPNGDIGGLEFSLTNDHLVGGMGFDP